MTSENQDQNEQNMQQIYMELQMAGSQIKEFERELMNIEEKKQELAKLKSSLDSLKEIPEGTNTLANIGSGIYVPAKAANTKELLVNIGAGAMVKKPVAEAQEMIDKQINQADIIALNIAKNIEMLSQHAQKIQQKIRGMM